MNKYSIPPQSRESSTAKMTLNPLASRNNNSNGMDTHTQNGGTVVTSSLNKMTNLRASADVKRSKAKKHRNNNSTKTNAGANKDGIPVGSSVL